jgi:hypothetical protein
MESISNLLGKSKKQTLYHQAYIVALIKEGLKIVQAQNYLGLEVEFENIELFIANPKTNFFVIKFKISDKLFKVFAMTELNNIEFELNEFLVSKGLVDLKYAIKIV